jgi:glyoxylase-like metal-dependent hydrolase (beta-lactamase superfamily II)
LFFPSGIDELLESRRPVPGNPLINDLFPGVYELPCNVPPHDPMPETYHIGKFTLTPLQVGGFTELQTVYMLDFNDRRFCFCGDALAAPGKIHAAYNFEHLHHTGTGQYRGVEALRLIRMERPEMLLPSHGEVVSGDIFAVLSRTMKALTELAEIYESNCPGVPASVRIPVQDGRFQRLSEHIYMQGNVYLLISETKEVLLIDFFTPDKDSFDTFIDDFRGSFPEHRITCVLISHFHFDHWLGISELRKIFPLRTGCCEFMADALENPPAYKRPFQHYPGTKIDMRFKDNQEFRWNEYAFTTYEFPGQTDLHSGYYSEMDGKKVFFTGDNFYPAQQWGGTGGLSSLNGGNPLTGWPRSIKLLLETAPDWVLASHSHPFLFSAADFKARLDWTTKAVELMKNISDEENFQLCFNQQLFRTYPYSQLKNSKLKVVFTAVNPTDEIMRVEVKPAVPENVRVMEDEVFLEIEPHAEQSATFNFRCSLKNNETAMVLFDISRNGRYLGQAAECFFC